MPIRYKPNIIYLGIPRTGTTSLVDFLNHHLKNGKGHKHSEIKSFNKENFYFTFTRNPYDRMISLYGWIVNINKTPLSFNEFTSKIINPSKSYKWVPQSVYIQNPKDFNFIGRYENYQEDIYALCGLLELTPKKPIKHLYQGKINHDKKYFTPEFIKAVNKMYKEDFIKFKYEMI